jgi:hypothetical protein
MKNFWKSIVDYIKNMKEESVKEPKFQQVQVKWDELTQAQACEVLFELIAQGRGIDIVRLRTKFPFLKYEVKK